MRYKDKELLDGILTYINNKLIYEQYNPTMQEIANHFSISKSTAHSYISELELNGSLKRKYENGRFDLSTKATSKIKSTVANIPIVGEIACGTPILADENIEDYVYISKEFLGVGEFFALRTKGDSMIDAGINDGDIVIVERKKDANNGEIVVAMTDENEVTLKRFYKEKDHIRLQPENDALEPIILNNCSILGKAVGLYRSI